MIFVTLGSQKFQFDRLLQKLDDMVENNIITEKIIAQIGASTYLPQHYEYVRFMDREQFAETMDQCDIVITHGGTGVIISAVKKGKKVIAIPRLAKYKEHVDDHQLQLLHQFDDLELICACYEVDDLEDKYSGIRDMKFKSYVSNTHTIIASIEEYLETI